MKVDIGTYTTTGASLDVATPGVNPDFVMVKLGDQFAIARTSSMVGDLSKFIGYSSLDLQAGYITALGTEEFTLGTSSVVNPAGGQTGYYIAIECDDIDSAVGFYTGLGTTGQDVALPFTPDLVLTIPANTRPPYLKTTAMGGSDSIYTGQGGVLAGGRITALGTNEFSVGTDNDVDQVDIEFHYLALKITSGAFDLISYLGDAVDDRDVPASPLDFDPEFAWIKGNLSDGSTPSVIRFVDESAGNSFLLDNAGEAGNRIQAFGTGQIELGTDVSVNKTGSVGYYGFALKNFLGGGDPPPDYVDNLLLLGVS